MAPTRALIKSGDNKIDYRSKTFNQLAKNSLGTNRWTSVEDYVTQLNEPLVKALATSGVSGMADGSNLVLQNLDSIMTSVLFTEEQLVKQRFIERVPSINPIYQWNRRNQYGSNRGAFGFPEGGIGPVGLGSWSRNQATVKFFGVQRGTTVVANLAGALGGMFDDPVQEEEYDGTMQLLGSVERMLVWGNKAIHDGAGNEIFYDGMFLQVRNSAYANTNILDMHNKPMDFDVVQGIAARYPKVFVPTSKNVAAFLTPDSLSTLQLMKNQAERRAMGTQAGDGGYIVGTPLKGYDTNIGWIPFVQDVFLDAVQGKVPLTTADASAPSTPASVTASAGAPGVGVTSEWQSSDAATVYYTVAAFNAQGESLGFTTAAGTAVAAGQVVTLTIPNVTGAFGYRVYRGTQANGSDAQWIWDVPNAGGANTTWVDFNEIIPGTDVAVFVDRSPQNIVIPQMAPLLKLPLAIQNTTIPFGLLYLHTLAVKAPERVFIVKNIGYSGYTN